MHEGARFAALMEVVDELYRQWQRSQPLPAEHIIRQYCTSRRYIGSKDRRFLHNSFFALLRTYGRIDAMLSHGEMAKTGRHAVLCWHQLGAYEGASLADICSGATAYHPTPLSDDEQRWLTQCADGVLEPWENSNMPQWLYARLAAQYGDAMLPYEGGVTAAPAPDIRVNRLRATRDELGRSLAMQDIETTPIDGLEDGLALTGRHTLTELQSFKRGWFELQDRGSQWIMQGLPISAGMTVLDYCAGAGGKSLLLASQYRQKIDQFYVHDLDEKRLERILPRAKRAGVKPFIHLPKSEVRAAALKVDMVVVDAPCSGTGTIRRHPDLPWRLSPSKQENLVTIQRDIIAQAATYVAPQGYLYYITCSLLEEENEQQIKDFMQANSDFRLVPLPEIWNNKDALVSERRIIPSTHDADGFFSALLQRIL